MNAVEIFAYADVLLRVVIADGESWFAAADVAAVLELGNVHSSLALLDDDEKGIHTVDTLGGRQGIAFVNEPGLYSLILRSRKPEAKSFRRWITHEVLPSIRKTGSYDNSKPATELSRLDILTLAIESENRALAAESRNAELEPAAAAWDELASTGGDYDVADAAKILARANIMTGRTRLFEQLRGLRWIHRGAQGKWKAYQSAVDSGWVAEKPMSHHHPDTDAIVLDAPQIRITVKGLERLRVALGTIDLTAAATPPPILAAVN